MLLQLLITTCSWNFYLFTDFLLLAFPGFWLGWIVAWIFKIVLLQHMTRQVVASYTGGEQVFTLYMQHEAVLWWQNHFGIILSQLLEHRNHVMHIRLPDKHNVVNHFCLQAFLSNIKTKFSKFFLSCCSSSTDILLFFKVRQRLARTSFWLLISFRVRSCP